VPGIDAMRPINVPPGTQHGALFRVDDAGLPNLRSGKRGDLVAVIQLIVPRKLNESQKKVLAEYAKLEELVVGQSNESAWDKIKRAVKGDRK
jgi:molecular chaperone DnaJ